MELRDSDETGRGNTRVHLGLASQFGFHSSAIMISVNA
jgi:hypothetical protein